MKRGSLLFIGLGIASLLGACGAPGSEELGPDGERQIETGAICPGATVVRGIDVSYWQGTINWTSVKGAGKQFAMIRHSDGSYLDPQRFTNWNNAKAAGLTVGFYQFFRASQDPYAQADLILAALNTVNGNGRPNLPPVIDIETYDGQSAATVISKVNKWLAYVQSKTGRQPVLYTSPGCWSGLGYPTPSPLPYLWDAHWTSGCPTVPSPWGRLRFWQYSATGAVSGISGDVDLDLYNGSLAEMQGL